MKQNNWTTSCTQNEAESARETLIWLESVTEKETGNAQPGACVDVLPRCCKTDSPYFQRLSPVSLSVFSLIPDLLLTARAHLNTQKYGLFCSLRTQISGRCRLNPFNKCDVLANNWPLIIGPKLIALRSRKFIACHSNPSVLNKASVLWCAKKKKSYAGPYAKKVSHKRDDEVEFSGIYFYKN